MPLSDSIFHKCVGAPTYFDVLPSDVIGHNIMPFLGWEDRIHLNMLTPPGDRTPPKKIPKDRIIAHQISVTIGDVERKVKAFWSTYQVRGVSAKSRHEALIDVLRTFKKGHNILIAKHSRKIRDVLERKVVEFSDPENLKSIRLLSQRAEMCAAVQTVIQLLDANPYSHDIKHKKWLSECVTQVECAIGHEEWRADGIRIRRHQGDIYSAME